MALDFLKGAAQGIVGSSLKKVAGNLPGLLGFGQGKGVGIPSSTSQQTHKYVSKNLSFPLDTEAPAGANGNHGHYIMFYINQQQNAKLSFSDPEKKEGGSIASIKGQQKIPEYIKKRSSSGSYVKVENNSGLKDQALDGVDPGMVKALKEIEKRKIVRAKGSTVSINRPPTTRLDTAIAMYMPQQVQVVYGAKYRRSPPGPIRSIDEHHLSDYKNAALLLLTDSYDGIMERDDGNSIEQSIEEYEDVRGRFKLAFKDSVCVNKLHIDIRNDVGTIDKVLPTVLEWLNKIEE